MNHIEAEELEEAVIVGFEHAINCAVRASEQGYSIGKILRAMRQAVIKLKARRAL